MGRAAKFVASLLPLFLAGCATVQSTSNAHGPAAHSIARLSSALTITFVITILIMWALLAIALKKNRGSLKEHMPIDVGGGQAWVAIGGIAIPFLVLSVFFFLGLDLLTTFPIHGDHGAMNMGAAAAKSKPDILIIGHQWWWEVHYLGAANQQVITANEIHIPAHRPVNIELRSADVIHSFWVPSLHGKVDLIPGDVNFIRIEASQPGDYVGQCAEYCGSQHANMHILLVAQEPAAFNQWLANQARPGVEPTNPETMQGQQAFLDGPCTKCHTVRGTAAAGRFGPDLTHIGSRKEIGADSFPNNDGYLEGWITNAQSLKPGCKMPKITQYNGTQLRSLVAYLRQLQ
ncbi:MAG: c-type cytochrome [Acidobacteria bacterium]|nr:c-type cytochrome [Acidobacteriota bacterium]